MNMSIAAETDADEGREHLPKRRFSVSFKKSILGTNYAGQMGFYADGRPAEIFLGMEKAAGTMMDVTARDLSVLISIALQRGASLDELLKSVTRDENNVVEGVAGKVLLEMQEIAAHVKSADIHFHPLPIDEASKQFLEHRKHVVDVVSAAFSGKPGAMVRAEAQMKGYTGDQCVVCENFTMLRNGTCLKCDTCGETTGCS